MTSSLLILKYLEQSSNIVWLKLKKKKIKGADHDSQDEIVTQTYILSQLYISQLIDGILTLWMQMSQFCNRVEDGSKCGCHSPFKKMKI